MRIRTRLISNLNIQQMSKQAPCLTFLLIFICNNINNIKKPLAVEPGARGSNEWMPNINMRMAFKVEIIRLSNAKLLLFELLFIL